MKNRIFIGISLIVMALILLLNILGYIPVDIPWIKIVIGVILITILINSLLDLSFWGIFLSLSILVIFFKDYIGLAHIGNIEILIVGVLLSIGFSLIFKNTINKRLLGRHNHDNIDIDLNDDNFVESINKEGILVYLNNFSAQTRFVKDHTIKKVIIKNNFGESVINIEVLNFDNNPIEIYIENNFGNVIVNVNRHFYIDNQMRNAFAGNLSVKGYDNDSCEGKIVLKGKINFGNVDIIKR